MGGIKSPISPACTSDHISISVGLTLGVQKGRGSDLWLCAGTNGRVATFERSRCPLFQPHSAGAPHRTAPHRSGFLLQPDKAGPRGCS